MFTLIGAQGVHPGRMALPEGRHRVGRGERADLNLDDRSVSREHAEILVERDRAWVRDLGSRNGTWVNNEVVTGSTAIQAGDRIRFGGLSFTLEIDREQSGVGHTSTWDAADLTMMGDRSQMSAVSSLSWDEARRERGRVAGDESLLMRALLEAGQLLVLPGAVAETCDQVLQVVEKVVPGRRFLLLLTDDDGHNPTVLAARPATTAQSAGAMLSRTIAETVLSERRALLLNDIRQDPRFGTQDSVIAQRIRAAMVAPLCDEERTIGLLYVDSDDPRAGYDAELLRAFTFLANLLAVKIMNSRLMERRQEQERMAREAAAAARVQRFLLGTASVEAPGYEALARHIPCYECGGDLHDTAVLDDGRLMLVVGDVTGKGMGAALLMSTTLAAMRVLYQEGLPLDVLAARVHRQLLQSSDEIHFVTLFFGSLDPWSHVLSYVNAGHVPPLVIAEGAETVRLATTGPPLGLLPDASFGIAKVTLPPGGLLCVSSDGIPEAMAGEAFYEEERLIACLRRHAGARLETIADEVIRDLRGFLGDRPLSDDVTLLLLRRAG